MQQFLGSHYSDTHRCLVLVDQNCRCALRGGWLRKPASADVPCKGGLHQHLVLRLSFGEWLHLRAQGWLEVVFLGGERVLEWRAIYGVAEREIAASRSELGPLQRVDISRFAKWVCHSKGPLHPREQGVRMCCCCPFQTTRYLKTHTTMDQNRRHELRLVWGGGLGGGD